MRPCLRMTYSPGYVDHRHSRPADDGGRAARADPRRHSLHRRRHLRGERDPALSRRGWIVDQVRSIQGCSHRYFPKEPGRVLDVQPQSPPHRCRAESRPSGAGGAGGARSPTGGRHPKHGWPSSESRQRAGHRATRLVPGCHLPRLPGTVSAGRHRCTEPRTLPTRLSGLRWPVSEANRGAVWRGFTGG